MDNPVDGAGIRNATVGHRLRELRLDRRQFPEHRAERREAAAGGRDTEGGRLGRERSEPAEGGGGSGRASEPRGAKAPLLVGNLGNSAGDVVR